MTPDTVVLRPLEATDLFADELVAVVPAGHPYAERPFLSGSDFLTETYLTYSLVKQPGFEADRVWAAEDVLPVHEEVIGSIEAITELIKAGFGISILSHWALSPQFDSGALYPVRTTPNGLILTWRALLFASADDDSPKRRVIDALVTWFAENPPPGLDRGRR